MDNDDPAEFRIGIFFYLMSAFTFAIFVASDFAKQADFDYFFGSLGLFAIGWFFRRKKQPPPRVERFTYAKNFLANQRKKRDERLKKKAPEKKK
jgi:hypothetical protein